MTALYVLLALAAGIAIGALFVRFALAKKGGDTEAAEVDAEQIIKAAESEAESIRKDAEVKGKELTSKIKGTADKEIRNRKVEIAKKEESVSATEESIKKKQKSLQRKEDEVARREKQLTNRESKADELGAEAEKALEDAKVRLEKVAGLSAQEARQKLTEQMMGEARVVAAAEIKRIEEETEKEASEKAKLIISTAVQRFAGEYVGERTVTVVPIPSDDMKGRLIGREGRNVRALEAATGVDMIIDDTPETITISCFNPVRRQIAQSAITRLLADGRTDP